MRENVDSSDVAFYLKELKVDMDSRFEAVESILSTISKRLQVKNDPHILSWDEAARLWGIDCKNPGEACKRRIFRERKRPSGAKIRTVRGGVNRQDFLNHIRSKQEERPGAGEIVRREIYM